MTATVMSYNILRGGEDRVDQIEGVIREVDPDVLVVVEAFDDETFTALAGRLGMQHVFSPARLPHHVAILSRHPVRLAHPESAAPGRRLSAMTPAFVQFPDCGDRLIVGVHLSSQLAYPWGGRKQRVAEIRDLLASLEPFRNVPHLLVGDFNAAPRDGGIAIARRSDVGMWFAPSSRRRSSLQCTLAWLHDASQHLIARPSVWPFVRPFVARINPWEVVQLIREAGYVGCGLEPSRPLEYSWPSWSPAARIDHIFATPDIAADVVDCHVVDTPRTWRASDHLPVVARLRWC